MTGQDIKVAVVDTGVQEDHPDLAPVVELGNARDNHGHGCITPDARVYTSQCGLQTIKETYDRAGGVAHALKDGTWVKDLTRQHVYTMSLNAESGKMRRRQVQAVHKIPYKGPLYKVTTGEGTLSLTPWHPVYVLNSQTGEDKRITKKRADEVKVGDRISLSDYSDESIADNPIQVPYRMRWVCRHCGREARAGGRTQCRGCNKHRWHDGPSVQYLSLDEDLAFLLGLIFADGHVMTGSRSVEFVSDSPELADTYETLVKDLTGLSTHRYEGKRQPGTIQQRTHSIDFKRLIESLGVSAGSTSTSIELPELVTKSPRPVIWSFLAGLIEGDGNVNDEGRIRVATGSQAFADQLVALLRTLGVRSSYATLTSPGQFSNPGSVSYSVRVGCVPEIYDRLVTKQPAGRPRQIGRTASSVRSIDCVPYDGYLYDFTVDRDHNYVADGHIVSNTHVAGIVAGRDDGAGMVGVAPEATILARSVFRKGRDYATARDVATGIERAVNKGAQVINLSLGSPRPSRRIHRAVRRAYREGVVVVAAAGNSGTDGQINYPGRYPETIAIGAVDKKKARTNWSQTGENLDFVAPGAGLFSTWPNDRYRVLSGTSMATPWVSGVIALMLDAHRTYAQSIDGPTRVEWVRSQLQQMAVDKGPVGVDDRYGMGLILPNRLAKDPDNEMALAVTHLQSGKSHTVDAENPTGLEYVELTNQTGFPVDLSLAAMKDEAGWTFEFPKGFMVGPGESFTIWTGRQAPLVDRGVAEANDLFWGYDRPVWNNDADQLDVTEEDGDVLAHYEYEGVEGR
jgi:intein/homing endonuclease